MKHFSEILNNKNRNIGLDLIRFIAVFYIFWGHGSILIPNELKSIYNSVMFIPIEGVSTFFVLSGFLIGGILLREINRQKFDYFVLLNFFKRRWYRTLPAYFFVLIILIIFKTKEWNYDFRYLIFLQNFLNDMPTFFGVSWSLAVEEWFYFLFPITLFILIIIFKPKKSIFFAIIIFLALPLIFRVFVYFSDNSNYEEIRKIVVFRFDSMMYGVLLAYIKYYNEKSWIFLKKYGVYFFIICFLMILYIVPMNKILQDIFLFNLESLIVFFCIPPLYYINLKEGFVKNIIVFGSKISYSIYLIHANLILWWWLRHIEYNNYLSSLRFEAQRLTLFLIYVVLTITLSTFVYLFVEKTFLKIRDKKTIS
jgi:peptidoglycan/LPS O-acetylase OafA/YrhL